jgi:hypothetical protein
MPYIVRTDADGKKEYFYTARSGKRDKSTKEAVERLRRLVNTNFKENSIKLELSYKPKTETSLLTVNK